MIDVVICDSNTQESEYVTKLLEMLDNDNEFQIIRFASSSILLQNLNDIHLDALFYIRISAKVQEEIRTGMYLSKTYSAASFVFVGGDNTAISEFNGIPRANFIKEKDLLEELPQMFKDMIEHIKRKRTSLLITQGDMKMVVNTKEILYLEREKRYTYIHLQDQSYRVSDTLHELLFHMPPGFKQCHYSYIINFNKVIAIKRNCFILENHRQVPISRSYFQKIETEFHKFIGHVI